jgi:hypothetical protein
MNDMLLREALCMSHMRSIKHYPEYYEVCIAGKYLLDAAYHIPKLLMNS